VSVLDYPRWPHQQLAFEELPAAILAGERRVCVTSPTGGGKCLGAGTPVLMFDGTIKAVEDIAAGELLMGPDSEPRTVLSVCRGREMLYRIDQKRAGESYVVNESHVLSLVMTGGSMHSCGIPDGSVVNLSVKDYLQRNRTFKHCAKGYRTGVEFGYSDVPLDPYFLGVWLGDGTSKTVEFTTEDSEVVDAMTEYATSRGVATKLRCTAGRAATYSISNGLKKTGHVIHSDMKSLNLFNNKHVPHIYKANSRDIRLGVLAGLIDTDGSLHRTGCYDIVFKSKQLADDTAFLARSLGFSSFLRSCLKECVNNGKVGTYYRVSVYGDVHEIPVRISRKVSLERTQKKNHLLTAISVTPIGDGDYYGFELDGDGLFLLGDFTVTHNTRIMLDAILWGVKQFGSVTLYTQRRMLFDQLLRDLTAAKISVGCRASGHKKALLRPVQLCMTQSECQAVYKAKSRELHKSGLVLLEEAHNQATGQIEQVAADHEAMGAAIVGITATPLGIGHMYNRLIVAGTNSELRRCGALVPAKTYGPDEPDLKKIKRQPSGEYTEKDVRKVIMTPTIFSRVYDNWKQLNPDAKPALLFAPGVAESLWFAQHLEKRGIRAAHIDGDDIYLDGETYSSDTEARDQIIAETKTGAIPIVCNRFVLREGIDMPWLYHGIFATVFGALTSYLQSGGRILRQWYVDGVPQLENVVIQDHGGNWHRHGSLNQDREWNLDYTSHIAGSLREEALREKKEPEPITCPKCHAIRLTGPSCHECGHTASKKTRMVVQLDGTLKEKDGLIYPPHRVKCYPNTETIWKQCYNRAKNSKNGMTFNQAVGLFVYENHYYPPKTMPFMPTRPLDWFEKVKSVQKEHLTGWTGPVPIQTPPVSQQQAELQW
jgi:superfamily II DNA or RNA helicase